MDDEAKAILRRIAESNENILKTLTKTDPPIKKVIDGIGIGAGIAGILSMLDLLKNWFGGCELWVCKFF
ncbi:MAG: hypothetical protein LBG73_05260 [Spirochaetaceae bacterium]|jgi:Na+-transporting NADH:ubiquinone oxidoreductase subunit NqrD|nr:hypothetical protein [Spirochaetaceae bacterium]